ncbi:MAG: peptidase M28 [Candidatus Rokuibacteriota bacterium]|nr:MAG: peptidase M28 [Candidatus Rokubacteria bacterium]
MTRRRAGLLFVVAALAGLIPPSARDARPAPPFDGAAALRHVERLVAIGPRPAGSPAGARARQYVVDELRRAGISARVEPFDADTPHGRLPMANVVAVLPGRRQDVILIGGHYDTKWFREFTFVGANDGGSSTALLIELARRLRERPREYTYWIAWFDGEEAREAWTPVDSLYGSRRMAGELGKSRRLPRAVIVADMIGDRDLGIRREAASSRWLTDIIWATATRLGHDAQFLPKSLAVEDDHAPFMRLGVPAALLIDFDFPPWHTAEDTLDKVSARSLEIVGNVLLEALPTIEGALTRFRDTRP